MGKAKSKRGSSLQDPGLPVGSPGERSGPEWNEERPEDRVRQAYARYSPRDKREEPFLFPSMLVAAQLPD